MNEEFDDIDLKTKLDYSLWKRIFKYLIPHKKYLILGIVSIIVTCYLETTLIEFLSEKGISRFQDGIKLGSDFIWFVIGMMGIIILEVLFSKLFIWSCARLELNLYKDMTNKTFDHLQSLSYSFYDKYSVGWLMARCTSDSSRVGEIISWGMCDLVWSAFKLIFILIKMVKRSWKLAALMLIIVPLMILVAALFRRIKEKYFWRVRKINSQVTSALNEGISGAKTSKSLVLEDSNYNKFEKVATKYRKTALKSVCVTTLYYQVISVMSATAIAVMCYFGAKEHLINPENLDYGQLFFCISCATMFFEPVLNIARVANQMKAAQVSASRVFNLMDVDTDVPDSYEVLNKYGSYDKPNKNNWEKLVGDVEFKDVDFAYKTGSGRKILENFNLKVKSGQSIALVGETGAGKSTIVNLLCRFYEPTNGNILIDGKDYRERSVGWLHGNLGYVMQTPHLFSGTITENILYGNPNATEEQVINAAKAANAYDFIIKLEKGFDTEVGEGGNRLSQGQKQLISFARAIIADPRILVLDEATSSIDTETEAMIQSAIHKILKGRTSFIIAHRLSTIVNSDLILVINGGKITEMGTHNQLMKNKDYYYRLYTNQFIDEQMKNLNF